MEGTSAVRDVAVLPPTEGTTNVPGPPVPLYLAGAELLEVFRWCH